MARACAPHRDALVADVIPDGHAGRAYGLIRALDHAGAVLARFAAAAVVTWGTTRLDIGIALSAIPGVLAVALIAFGVQEPARAGVPLMETAPLRWAALSDTTRRYLLVLVFFTPR